MSLREWVRILPLQESDIGLDFLDRFDRRQVVTKVVRGCGDQEDIEYDEFDDDWDRWERIEIVEDLLRTLRRRGAVFGAFFGDELVGFALIDNERLGPEMEYVQLRELHVDHGYRGKGIGKELFRACVEKAREFGAGKIYISSHSALETVEFYKNLGCAATAWIYPPQVEKEPTDYQMEYRL